jgi:hypothetical protein
MARLTVGGQPEQAYALTMNVHFRYVSDAGAIHQKWTTYTYRSASSDLTQDAIDEAKEEFHALMSNPETHYRQAEIEIVRVSDIEHKPYDEVKLSALPLYNFHRLGLRYCPDDAVINITPGECVIDGLLSFLWASDLYKTASRERLIEQLGTSHPSVDEIEQWVTSDRYSYRNYVSIYILDPFRRRMLRHIAKTNTEVTMKFYINHQHIYAITSEQLHDKIENYERLDLTKLENRDSMTSDNVDYC